MGSPLPYQHLDDLLAELRDHHVMGQVVAVDYEFQAEGNQMLVCRFGGQ
jgi:hypothetical protein